MSGKRMPYLRKWFEENMGVEVDYRTPSVRLEDVVIPEPIDNQLFISFLLENRISYSNKSIHRLIRSHGHTGMTYCCNVALFLSLSFCSDKLTFFFFQLLFKSGYRNKHYQSHLKKKFLLQTSD